MTLRQLGHFAGLGSSTPPPTDGRQALPAPITMHAIARNLSPMLSASEQKSLRAMLHALPRLPPITLDANIVGNFVGEAPYQPTVHVVPSNGAVLSTGLTVFLGLDGAHTTRQVPVFQDVPNAPGDTRLTTQFATFGTSTEGYVLRVTRAGVQSSGLVILTKDLFFRVNLPAQPHPSGPTPTPPPPVPTPASTKYSKVEIYNCHANHRALDIRMRDLTAGQDYETVVTLAAQYDENGFCPASGSAPAEIALTDKHSYEIVALDSEMPGCIINDGDPLDPHNANCWREHIVLTADKNATPLQVTIA
jgi:hypothetical protein